MSKFTKRELFLIGSLITVCGVELWQRRIAIRKGLLLVAIAFNVSPTYASVNSLPQNDFTTNNFISLPHHFSDKPLPVVQETAAFVAVMESAQLMARYYKQGQLRKAELQHQTTMGLFKTLPPLDLILGAFRIQSLFGPKDYPLYIIDYSEVAFPVAVENNYVELAAQHLGQIAALFWTKNQFPQAMRAFKGYGAFADPFITVNPYDDPDQVIRQDLAFKDFLRRYVRFMFNTDATSHRPLCQQNDCLNLAWDMAERIKSRLFRADVLRGALQKLNDREQQQAQVLLQRVKQAKLKRIYSLYQTNNLLVKTAYDGEIQNIEAQLSRLVPEYKDLAVEVASPAAVSEALTPDETLLSFFYTDNPRSVYVWKIEKGKAPVVIPLHDPAESNQIVTTEDLYYSIELLKWAMERNPSLEDLTKLQCPPDVYNHSTGRRKLSCLSWFRRNVTSPLNLQPGRRLIIATDQNLAALPFDLLPWNESQLMMDVFDITYVPSMTVFYQLRKKHLQETLRSSAYKYTYAGFAYKNQNDPVNKLTWADSEVENAAEGMTQPLTKLDAYESDLYANSERLASTRYIHIVTHNNLFSDSDSSFYLQLGRDNREDGKLTGYEIVNRLKNNAELVVLSACQTALRPRPGNEVVGLDPSAREPSGALLVASGCICTHGESFSNLSGAFFAAGSKRLMLTQWRLPDSQGTQEFVTRFFVNLKAGKTPAEALRLAKQEMRDEYFKAKDDEIKKTYNPAFWAGFILVGD